ncbi:CLUMA_CG019784, isoform A [Clunio marinus]|uniref:CLUMA_CG019784, isoform A n=1 Tax=Clunio marinus TaxID=568069 RepID=A0A1J1J586_9DIPT|nr:CLUMA_CG019784, isoform A [Clunio marinus]
MNSYLILLKNILIIILSLDETCNIKIEQIVDHFKTNSSIPQLEWQNINTDSFEDLNGSTNSPLPSLESSEESSTSNAVDIKDSLNSVSKAILSDLVKTSGFKTFLGAPRPEPQPSPSDDESDDDKILEDCPIDCWGQYVDIEGDCYKECPDDKFLVFFVIDLNTVNCCCGLY